MGRPYGRARIRAQLGKPACGYTAIHVRLSVLPQSELDQAWSQDRHHR